MQNNESKRKYIVLGVIILVVIISIVGIVLSLNSDKTDDNSGNENNNNEVVVEDAVGDLSLEVLNSTDEGRNLSAEIKALNATYSDAIAWLKVPGTVIDFPIFQSKDNDRYLRHDRDNKATDWGEPFLDYRCNIGNIGKRSHFIIYGHNSETNDNFTPLINYKRQDFYNAHKQIEFSSVNGNYTWEIFSIYITDTNDFYIKTEFDTDAEFLEFFNDRKNMSIYNTGVSISGSDTVLTLSTCDYTRTDGRLVIHAKLVK